MKFTLIKGGSVYTPEPIGIKDVLLYDGKVMKIGDRVDVPYEDAETEYIDARGRYVVPGFIDYHNHFLGGGGNSGYSSRAPEIPFSRFMLAGVTTVVGCLGADCMTRSMQELYGKACALESDGMTAYIYSGATYTHPVPTLTGSIPSDIYYVDKVIGAGEVSLSDLGASYDSLGAGTEYIARVSSQVILGSRISGKAGLICLQVPSHGVCLEPLFEILDRAHLPIQHFVPAHANQTEHYFESEMKFGRRGGVIDLTSSYAPHRGFAKAIKPSRALKILLEEGFSYDQITMTTDGGGAHPHGDFMGRPTGSDYLPEGSLFEEFRDMVVEENEPLEKVLQVVSSNAGRILRFFGRKGVVQEGADADLLVLTDDIRLDKVVAKGRLTVDEGESIVFGAFEQII